MSRPWTRRSRSVSSASASRLLPRSPTTRSYSGPKRCRSRRRRDTAITPNTTAPITMTATTIEHPPEHPGGVFDRLLLADLGFVGPETGDVRALVVGGDLECRPGTGGSLLEDEGDVAPGQARPFVAGRLGRLELAAKPDQVAQLVAGEVELLEKVAVTQVNRHLGFLLDRPGQAASRWMGQTMQRGPPRPGGRAMPHSPLAPAALTARLAKTPVRTTPVRPPTMCTPTMSRTSSSCSRP